MAKELNFEFNVLNLEDIFSMSNEKLTASLLSKYIPSSAPNDNNIITESSKAPQQEQPSLDNRKKLLTLLENLSELGSCREDIMFHLKTTLITDFALKKGFNKIFVGDTAQKIATKSLAALCKGRGVNLFSDIALTNKKIEGTEFMRPMNDFLTKEILLYNHLHKMDPFFVLNPALADMVNVSKSIPGNGSIDRVLEKFIDKLQSGFPSTVHTILNTLDKIKPKYENNELCPLCLGKRDKISNVLEKGSVIDYIKPQSDLFESKANVINVEEEDERIKKIYLNSEFYKNKTDLERVCCFACGRIIENSKNQKALVEALPQVVKESYQQISNTLFGKIIKNDNDLINYSFYQS